MQRRTEPSFQPPWSCLCKIKFKFGPNQQELATGWVASDNTIVTAAHAVFDDAGKKANRVQGVLGQYQNIGLYRFEFESSVVVEAPEWKKGADKSWDLAVIRLKRKIPPRYSYLRCDGRSVEEGGLMLAGYPAKSNVVEFASVRVHANGARLNYRAPTTAGMSGCPLFVSHEGQYWVLGVHTHNQNQTSQAVFLDKQRIEWINSVRVGWDRNETQ